MPFPRSSVLLCIILTSLALAPQDKPASAQKPSEKDSRQFSLLKGEMNGRPFFAIIASDLKTYPPKSKFPWFLSLSTPLIGPTADGLPQGEDFAALNAWEDEMETQVAKLGKYFYVGHVNWNGSREALFYLEKPEPIVTALAKVRDSHSTRRFDFHCEKDKEWKKVSRYLGTVTPDSSK